MSRWNLKGRLLCWLEKHDLRDVYRGSTEGSDVLMCRRCGEVRYRLREPVKFRGVRL